MLDLKRAIKEAGKTQREVAEELNITLTSLNQILKGNPTYNKLKEIAKVLNVDVVDLFFDEGKKEESPKNQITCPKCGAKFELKEVE